MTDQIVAILSQVLKKTKQEIFLFDKSTERYWDSLQMIEILFCLEQDFGITIENADIPSMKSISSIEAIVSAAAGKKMKHNISKSGYSYSLRPAEIADSDFIVEIRTGDAYRNRHIHALSSEVSQQRDWMRKYYEREGDYYFVVENLFTGRREGLIGIYDVDRDRNIAEWGRWVLLPDSLAATESVDLACKIAFEKLGLDGLYSRTIKDNEPVVSFHDSLGAMNMGTLRDEFEIGGRKLDAVKHVIDRETWKGVVSIKSEKICRMIYDRMLGREIAKMTFHHIGIAAKDMVTETRVWETLGYRAEGAAFEDAQQGIRGMFVVAHNQPRLEIMENLPNATTLDAWLGKGVKFYHFAYLVDNIDDAIVLFTKKCGGKLISPKKKSVAFDRENICFIIFFNGLVIELIEKKRV